MAAPKKETTKRLNPELALKLQKLGIEDAEVLNYVGREASLGRKKNPHPHKRHVSPPRSRDMDDKAQEGRTGIVDLESARSGRSSEYRAGCEWVG